MDLIHELCPLQLLEVTKKSDILSVWLASIQHLAHMYLHSKNITKLRRSSGPVSPRSPCLRQSPWSQYSLPGCCIPPTPAWPSRSGGSCSWRSWTQACWRSSDQWSLSLQCWCVQKKWIKVVQLSYVKYHLCKYTTTFHQVFDMVCILHFL